MKTQQYRNKEERTILTALIVNTEVLGRVSQRLGEDARPFRSKWCNLIARWCFAHFAKYQKAPRAVIESLFEKFAQESRDQEVVGLVESFLAGLSRDYKQLSSEMNEAFLIDMASTYFEKVRLDRACTQTQEALERNDVQEARESWSSFETIDFSSKAWRDIFADEDIHATFQREKESQVLVRFPGDLDKFLSPYFERTAFVAFTGPEKRGKSFWLQEVVWQALRQKRRILYYAFGDMSEDDIRQRFYCRALRRPWREEDENVRIPTKLNVNGNQEADLEFRKEIRKRIRPKDVRAAREKLKQTTATDELRLQLRVEGGAVVSAGEIEQEVKRKAAGGWPPDVIVIDYADLLASEPHTRNLEVRHQINATWMVLRRIALEHHCLVVTGTQTAKSGYTAHTIGKSNFSEDKRKNAHVTGMIGINQTDDEHKRGIYRLNWVLSRKAKYSQGKVVWCAGNLSIACPCIISSF